MTAANKHHSSPVKQLTLAISEQETACEFMLYTAEEEAASWRNIVVFVSTARMSVPAGEG